MQAQVDVATSLEPKKKKLKKEATWHWAAGPAYLWWIPLYILDCGPQSFIFRSLNGQHFSNLTIFIAIFVWDFKSNVSLVYNCSHHP